MLVPEVGRSSKTTVQDIYTLAATSITVSQSAWQFGPVRENSFGLRRTSIRASGKSQTGVLRASGGGSALGITRARCVRTIYQTQILTANSQTSGAGRNSCKPLANASRQTANSACFGDTKSPPTEKLILHSASVPTALQTRRPAP